MSTIPATEQFVLEGCQSWIQMQAILFRLKLAKQVVENLHSSTSTWKLCAASCWCITENHNKINQSLWLWQNVKKLNWYEHCAITGLTTASSFSEKYVWNTKHNDTGLGQKILPVTAHRWSVLDHQCKIGSRWKGF